MRTEAEIRAMLTQMEQLLLAYQEAGLNPGGVTTARHTLEWVLGERD